MLRILPAVLLIVMVGSAVPASASGGAASVYCANGNGDTARKPKKCEFYSRVGVAGTYVTGMRWHHWGTAKATATGTFRGNMDYHSRVTVRLSRRVTCQVGSPKLYTYATFQFKGGRPSGGRLVGCDGTSP